VFPKTRISPGDEEEMHGMKEEKCSLLAALKNKIFKTIVAFSN